MATTVSIFNFPACVRGYINRSALAALIADETKIKKLWFTQTEHATRDDMSVLIAILSKQKSIYSVVFKNMTFIGFVAQLMVGMMSRYAPVEIVAFDVCKFKHYQQYRCRIRRPCGRVFMNCCSLKKSFRAEFISFFFDRIYVDLQLEDSVCTAELLSFFSKTRTQTAPAA
jgi:hypothetical protein